MMDLFNYKNQQIERMFIYSVSGLSDLRRGRLYTVLHSDKEYSMDVWSIAQ